MVLALLYTLAEAYSMVHSTKAETTDAGGSTCAVSQVSAGLVSG